MTETGWLSEFKIQTKITITEQLLEQFIYHQYSNEVLPLFNNTEYLRPSKAAHDPKDLLSPLLLSSIE